MTSHAFKKAITSCEHSGNDPGNHFAGARKMVDMGSEVPREVPDYHLSRFTHDHQPLLGYNHWRSIENAAKKAITSCKQSGNELDDRFAGARKPIPGDKGIVQTRCYAFHLTYSSLLTILTCTSHPNTTKLRL